MRPNHLSLTVTDGPAAARPLETYFGLRDQLKGNKGFALLFDDGGLPPSLMKGAEVAYPKTFHIGFTVEVLAE